MKATDCVAWFFPLQPADEARLFGGVMESPMEMLHNPCEACGLPVHPANNVYLIADIIERENEYGEGKARHFTPLHAYGQYLCPGTPAWYQLLDGVSVLAPIDPALDRIALQRAWRRGFGEAMRRAGVGSRPECFSFEYKDGIWVQEYRCRWVKQIAR